MKHIELNVEKRTETGTGPNYRLRVTGRVPAVIYGAGSEPEKVSINYRDFERLMKTPDAVNAILNVKGTGAVTTAVIREVQRDPVTRRFLHVDLYRVRMDVESVFEVAVHGEGSPIGVREGGILETHIRTVEVRCLPTNLPTSLHIDLSDLHQGSSLHVRDLQLPEGVVMITGEDEVLHAVVAPQKAAAVAEEAAPAAEPEVVGKKEE